VSDIERPYYPIIYVRGYAGSRSEVEQTVATPYMGFNLGSTKIRQRWTGELSKHVFESPLVRLMKEFGYTDAYRDGTQAGAGHEYPARTVFIYRYYDRVSEELGSGGRPEIVEFARGLGDFILDIRRRICGQDPDRRSEFKVYLVAHSMGGLVCRCFLQNPDAGQPEARALVDKVFTYATPHNGIELAVLGNVPGFFSRNNSRNFNRNYMRLYLSLPRDAARTDALNGCFPEDRFFCLVGTNSRDYEPGAGLVRRVVGELSDGLVRIDNASVKGAPRAFVHRSHSGDYGIVNSEEGYQNLVRFLFGDYRVDGVLHVAEIRFPPKVRSAQQQGRSVRASYHFEVVARVRGAAWDLHRRTTEERSAVFRTFDEMLRADVPRSPKLFSLFLSRNARVNRRRPSLGFSIDIGVLVPEYEVGGTLFLDDHYDGGYLFRDKLNLELSRERDGEGWKVRYGFDSATPNRATRWAESLDAGMRFTIPIEQRSQPGIRASLELSVRLWEHGEPTPNAPPRGRPRDPEPDGLPEIVIRPLRELELPPDTDPLPIFAPQRSRSR